MEAVLSLPSSTFETDSSPGVLTLLSVLYSATNLLQAREVEGEGAERAALDTKDFLFLLRLDCDVWALLELLILQETQRR